MLIRYFPGNQSHNSADFSAPVSCTRVTVERDRDLDEVRLHREIIELDKSINALKHALEFAA